MRLVVLLITGLLLSGKTVAAPNASDEILSALQTHLEAGTGFESLLEQLEELSGEDLKKLQTDFDKTWIRLSGDYLAAFEAAARDQNSGTARQKSQARIKELRDEFHRVRGMPEGAMKGALKKTSWPALTELRELLLPDPARILEGGGADLQTQRRLVISLATFRDGLLQAAIAIEPPESQAGIIAAEQKVSEGVSGLERDGLRLMANNRKAAEKANLPEPERLGIADANLMRLLVGLSALALDPRLCDAARDHSKDMATLAFFDHQSPVKGKGSFVDRARLAGTTAASENIYKGSENPKGANRGWFHSPGHHKNMFGAGHRRIGLGNHVRHWTQMFGR